MKTFVRFLIAFFAITGASAIATSVFGLRFENAQFWEQHGFLFLLFITIFPRLTLLLSNVVTGGLIWWLAWLFAPRILIATLATLVYWNQNPILVVLSWLVAFGGESSEKYVMVRRGRGMRSGGSPASGRVADPEDQHFDRAKWVKPEP